METDVNIPNGTLPTYDSATPSRANDLKYVYIFNGWEPEVNIATKNQDYFATYNQIDRYPIITWDAGNGEFSDHSKKKEIPAEYGTIPTPPSSPSQAETEDYTFSFSGWTPSISVVTGATVYTATYTSAIKPKRVTSITFPSSSITLTKGSSTTLVPNVLPVGYTDTLTWWTTNTAIATVTQNGYVTAINEGTATIRVVAMSSETPKFGVKADVTITVIAGGGKGGSGGGGGGGSAEPKSSGVTFSPFWKQGADGVWRIYNDGQMVTKAWLNDDAVAGNGNNVWYLINTDGSMLAAGLVQDNTGNFYSLETEHNGYFGMLRYKNGTYNCNGQQVYLEFEQSHNGAFGAIKNADGLAKLKQIYGITRFGVDNSSCQYTSTFK